jgi:RNA polymerase sigma-70 factor (sigma-E family)
MEATVDMMESPPVELHGVVAADFNTVYERNYRRALGLAYSLTGDRGSAEDLVQEAFLNAHKNWSQVSRYDDPMHYVKRVISTRAVSRWRKLGRESLAMGRLRGRRSDHVEQPTLRDPEFWNAVRALPAQQRQVVTLHYVEDMAVDQIAMVLERSSGTVKTQLFRARQTLAQQLGAETNGAGA